MIFRNFEQNQDFWKFWQNFGSPKILTKFDIIYEIVDNIRDFRKSKILTNAKIFKKFWLKAIFSENFDQNQHFRKFWPKSRILWILIKVKIFEKFW